MDTLFNREKSYNSLEYFMLDLDIYNDIFKDSERIKESVENYKDIIPTFENLSQDIYLSVFKANPIVKKSEEIDIRYRLNNILIRRIFQIDEFKDLRDKASLNYFNSILASELIGGEIVKGYEKLIKKDRDFRDIIKEYNENIKKYEEINDALKILRSKLYSVKDKIIGEEIIKNDKALKILGDKIENNLKAMDDRIGKDNLVYKSVTVAYKELSATIRAIKSWGLDDGKLTVTSYEEKVAVTKKLRSLKKIREISEMAGRFKASASKLQKRKTKEEGQEICGVKLGSEVHKILPSEKLLLAKENTKRSFYKKYNQNELLSYKYKNNKAKSKGPIICCVDTSSSMTGEREVWSKSVAMTLLDIAIKQKRDFAAILFSNRVYKTIEFSKNKVEPNKIYELATFFYGSGTNFVEPLYEAIGLIDKARYKYSDIVFITDGEALLDDEFIEEFNIIKEKKEFRMITVNVSEKIEEVLDSINDIQILLKDLSEEEVDNANETLFTI